MALNIEVSGFRSSKTWSSMLLQSINNMQNVDYDISDTFSKNNDFSSSPFVKSFAVYGLH